MISEVRTATEHDDFFYQCMGAINIVQYVTGTFLYMKLD